MHSATQNKPHFYSEAL